MDFTQEQRRLQIETPLESDVLRLVRFEGSEEISSLFKFDLELVSADGSIDPRMLVGKRVSFAVEMPNEGVMRWFDGYVSQFSYRGKDDRQHHYYAEVVPWLWFCTQTTDCRIFQDMSIPEIVRTVLGDCSAAKFEFLSIVGKHPKWENCTQYRETDYQFITRLLEQEGFYFYFRHEQGQHTLVISDSVRGYHDCIENSVAFTSTLAAPDPYDQITAWEHRYSFRTGKIAVADYNFKTPTKRVASHTTSIVKFAGNAACERYDFPGEVESVDEAHSDVKLRMEEQELSADIVIGKSKCRSFGPGGLFKLNEHHNPQESGKGYVITGIRHFANMGGDYVSGTASDEVMYENHFTAIPEHLAYRPVRQTPKPYVRGLQTAIVVGDPGEEIHVDEFGRIRVRFHWDRYKTAEHDSSCWIRVMQPIAGDKWGFQFIPRVGQEVVVSFLEGDPDRPIVTGSVYHAEHMPPYDLPKNKTQSGIKTRSTLNGTPNNFNEIRFEDKKGQEQLYIQAEKDLQFLIKNDHTGNTGRNESLNVGNNRSKSIGSNETVSVGANRTETVGGDESITISGNQTVQIGANKTHVVGANSVEQVGVAKTIVAGTNVVINAGVSITLQCGASTIHMNQAGFITISGTVINIAAAVNANMAAPITNVAGAILSTNTGAVNLVTGANTLIATGGSVARVTASQVETIAKGDNVVQGALVKINT